MYTYTVYIQYTIYCIYIYLFIFIFVLCIYKIVYMYTSHFLFQYFSIVVKICAINSAELFTIIPHFFVLSTARARFFNVYLYFFMFICTQHSFSTFFFPFCAFCLQPAVRSIIPKLPSLSMGGST